MKNNCLVIVGPTASGKTNLACNLAYHLNGEIISADSRQVYKHLNIGSGKDLSEYKINEQQIQYHLIDLVEPTEQFYLHQFIAELKKCFESILSKNKLPIICGGTGLYLDTLRKDFSFTQIKENQELREVLENISKEELILKLKKLPLGYTKNVDWDSKKRLIRALEIADHLLKNKVELSKIDLPYRPYYVGIRDDIETRKKLISERLLNRLQNGLIEEVESLLISGVTHQRLELLGLEYKFVSYYLQNKISKEELFPRLQTSIFQFAKRQMTWFRKMEKEGVHINWLTKPIDLTRVLEEIETN